MLRDDRAGRSDSPQWKNYRENCWTSFELVSRVSSVSTVSRVECKVLQCTAGLVQDAEIAAANTALCPLQSAVALSQIFQYFPAAAG